MYAFRFLVSNFLTIVAVLSATAANAACDPSTDLFACPQIAAEKLLHLGSEVALPKHAIAASAPQIPTPQHTKPTPQFAACLSKLKTLASAIATTHPNKKDPACTIPQPVSIRSVSGIFFKRPLTLDCPYALVLAGFISNVMQPLARSKLNDEVNGLTFGPGYVCRRRNNAKTGKLSEHAFGNAIDLAAFHFTSGKSLSIRSVEDMQPVDADFFSTLRAQSCKTFTTVLGPGTNPAHATHLHFDLGRSKTSKNPYRICE